MLLILFLICNRIIAADMLSTILNLVSGKKFAAYNAGFWLVFRGVAVITMKIMKTVSALIRTECHAACCFDKLFAAPSAFYQRIDFAFQGSFDS